MVFLEGKEPIDIGFEICYSFIDVCGVVLHVLLFYAFLKDPLKCFKNLRMSFVINLAISDFLVCLFSLFKVLTINHGALYSVSTFLKRSVFVVSCVTIASISVDRFLLIMYPIKHRYWIKGTTITIWLSCIWLVSVCYGAKRLILEVQHDYEHTVYMGLMITLFVLTGTAYAAVYVHFKKQSRTVIQQNDSNDDRAEKLRLLKEKRFLKTIILIALIAVATFLPGWILFLGSKYQILPSDNLASRILLKICALLMGINFAINPLVYIFRFPNYRKTFQILCCSK